MMEGKDRQVPDFSIAKDHRHDGSIKWMQPEGREDVLGMGTADLDFDCPDCIRDAFRPITESNIYNYRYKPDEYYDAIISFFRRRYGFEIGRDWISNIPGTIAAVCIAIRKFSRSSALAGILS